MDIKSIIEELRKESAHKFILSKDDLNNLSDHIDALLKQKESLEEKNVDYENRLKHIQAGLKEKKANVETLDRDLSATLALYNQEYAEKETLSKQMDALRKQLEEKDMDLEKISLDLELVISNAEIREAKLKKERMRRKEAEQSAEKAKMSAQHAEKTLHLERLSATMLNGRIASLEKENDELRSLSMDVEVLENIKSRNTLLGAENETLLLENMDLKTNMANLGEFIAKTEKVIKKAEELEEDLQKERSRNAEMENIKVEHEAGMKKLYEDNVDISNRLAELRRSLITINEDRIVIMNQKIKLTDENKILEDEMKSAKKEIEELTAETKKLSEMHADMLRQVEDAEEEKEDLLRWKVMLEDQISNLESQNSDLTVDIEDLRLKLMELTDQNKKLAGDLERMENEYEDELAELREEMEKHLLEKEDHEGELEELREEMEKHLLEKEDHEGELAELKEEIEKHLLEKEASQVIAEEIQKEFKKKIDALQTKLDEKNKRSAICNICLKLISLSPEASGESHAEREEDLSSVVCQLKKMICEKKRQIGGLKLAIGDPSVLYAKLQCKASGLKKQGKYHEAINEYKRAFALVMSTNNDAGTLSWISFWIAEIYYSWKIYDKTLKYATKSLRYSPKNTAPLMLRAKALYSLKRFDEASDDLKQLLEKSKDNERASRLLHKCSHQMQLDV